MSFLGSVSSSSTTPSYLAQADTTSPSTAAVCEHPAGQPRRPSLVPHRPPRPGIPTRNSSSSSSSTSSSSSNSSSSNSSSSNINSNSSSNSSRLSLRVHLRYTFASPLSRRPSSPATSRRSSPSQSTSTQTNGSALTVRRPLSPSTPCRLLLGLCGELDGDRPSGEPRTDARALSLF